MPSARTIALGGFQDSSKTAGRAQGAGRGRAPGAPARAKADTSGEAARASAARRRRRSSLAELPTDEEFALVVTRRSADGGHEPVAVVDDEALDRAGHPPRRILSRARGVVPVGAGSIGPPRIAPLAEHQHSMTAHTRLDQAAGRLVRKALTGNALPGETRA